MFVLALCLCALALQSDAQCTNFKIPRRMCLNCRMRPHDDNGNFNRDFNKDIYVWNTTACMNQLRRYAALNPCDTARTTMLQEPITAFKQQRIAVFLYSVCEQCCDCVPIGAKPWEYESRKEAGTLVEHGRGNCAAHYYYDICGIWRNVSRVIPPWGTEREGLTQVCPQFTNWINSPDANGWLQNPNADGLTPDMLRAMRQLTDNTQCDRRSVWRRCTRLERAQGRV